MRWILVLGAACALAACASSQDLAGQIQANRTAGRPVFIYTLGLNNIGGYVNAHTVAGIGLINIGHQPITGVSITFVPYQTAHSPILALGPETLDLSAYLPAGGIPPDMGATPSWDNGSSLMDCFRMQRVDLIFADGSRAALEGKDLDAAMASRINRGCSSSMTTPDYKAFNLPPVTPNMSGKRP